MSRSPVVSLALAAMLLVPSHAPARTVQEGTSTLGHARTRAETSAGRIPAPGDVVVEDLIDHHHHDLSDPRPGEDVALRLDALTDRESGNCEEGISYLQVGISTPHVRTTRCLRPLHVAIVVDASGSMADDDKMRWVKRALRAFLREARPEDRVHLIRYSDDAEVVVPGCSPRAEDAWCAIDRIEPVGSTNLNAGLVLGFQSVRQHLDREATNRVILLTDGMANEGVTDPAEIARTVRSYRECGIDLTTVGVGHDYDRELLQTLAREGRGPCHFVADQDDLEKVFVAEAQSLFSAVARDVQLRVSAEGGAHIEGLFGHEDEHDLRQGERRGEHRGERGGDELCVRLRDLALGVTQVVILRVRVPAGTEHPRFAATLTYSDDDTREHRCLESRLAPPSDEGRPRDLAKNLRIAFLAEALHEAAQWHAKGCDDRALRVARRALERTSGDLAEDPEVKVVADMLRHVRDSLREEFEG